MLKEPNLEMPKYFNPNNFYNPKQFKLPQTYKNNRFNFDFLTMSAYP